MKTILSICIAALVLSACGSSSTSDEAKTNPTGTNNMVKPMNNPAHGMPGHDCGVPEGAPLPQQSTVQPQMNNTAPVQMPAGMNKAVKLNPAHGQPDHRCDIAVGAPLS